MILIGAIVVATVWTVAPEWTLPTILAVGILGILTSRRPDPGPVTITRLPTAYERDRHARRWGWAIGLGLTTIGPFPFITVYRRRRG